jgi:hypothetical protein
VGPIENVQLIVAINFQIFKSEKKKKKDSNKKVLILLNNFEKDFDKIQTILYLRTFL